MPENTATFRHLRGVVLAVLIALLFSLLPRFAFAAPAQPLITSFSALKSALQSAKDGDTLYVGDIDFTPPGSVANSWMRVEITKDIAIKNGKIEGKAVFTNGGFILSGGKTHNDGIAVFFEDIVFDGAVDTTALTSADFEYPWDEVQQQYILLEPRKAQYAISCEGNVDASFENCDFRNYMHEYGPVMHIRYGDYTTIPSLLEMFGDYSNCTLNLCFNHCNISGNAACYDGGAIYIEGNNNVTLTADNCVFADNRSGGGEFCVGGGAIYAQGAQLSLAHCRVENNTANYIYPGTALPEMDTVRGGGLYINNAKLVLKDSTVVGNTASMGGGIAFTNADADIDGCVLTRNRAQTDVVSPYGDTGPWTNMAQGGAIYHEGSNGARVVVVNSSIYANSAKTAYGGIYSYYNVAYEEMDASYLDLLLCDYVGNTCDAKYDYSDAEQLPWCTHPGDIWTIPYVTIFGCIVVDEALTEDFPRYEMPSLENRYTYFASPNQAESDGIRFSCAEQPAQLSVKVPKGLDFQIPNEYAERLLSGCYSKVPKMLHAGSNYDAALYSGEDRVNGIAPLAVVGCAVLLIVGVLTILYLRWRKQSIKASPPLLETAAPDAPKQPEKKIVKAWFTLDEIDMLLKSYPKVQTLTGREVEVLREILEGKKQKEIAYDLGIEITTVKDFYRKIYNKLELANKDDLLRKFSEVISK